MTLYTRVHPVYARDVTGIWRDPDEETEDYPGFVVHDGRMAGALTIGRSRLPLYSVLPDALTEESVEYAAECFGSDITRDGLLGFLSDLLGGVRGEFARLILAIANAERLEQEREDVILAAADTDGSGLVDITPGREGAVQLPPPWWDDAVLRAPVVDLLRRCLAGMDVAS